MEGKQIIVKKETYSSRHQLFNGEETSKNQLFTSPSFTESHLNYAPQLRQGQSQMSAYLMPDTMFYQVRHSIDLLGNVFPEIFNRQIVQKLRFALQRKYIKNRPEPNPIARQPQPNGLQMKKKEEKLPSVKRQETADTYFDNIQDVKNEELYFSDEEDVHEPKKEIKRRRGRPRKTQIRVPSKPKEPSNKKQLIDIWNETFRRQFAELYLSRKPFMEIRDFFVRKYPQHIQYFQYHQLRSESYKVIRLGMRKLIYIAKHCQDSALPKLIRNTEKGTNYLYYHKEGYEMRLLLVELYLMKELNINFMSKLIQSINNFFREIAAIQNENVQFAKKEPSLQDNGNDLDSVYEFQEDQCVGFEEETKV